MAYSKCPKCENTTFELEINAPKKSNYKMAFIQCSSCKTVIGVTDYHNIGAKVEELEKEIKTISSRVNNMNAIVQYVETIHNNVIKLFNLVKQK